MSNSVHRNIFVLHLSILLFDNIDPVTMKSLRVKIEGLEPLFITLVDRLIGVINPTIIRFQNVTIDILSVLENRTNVSISETVYWFETSLFVLLFAVIVFFIFLLILQNILNILLVKYQFLPEERRVIGLVVIIIIFVWLFIAMGLSIWWPTIKLDLQTLEHILVGLLSSALLYILYIWICYFYNRRTHIL
ncbi:unnamed protein product [Rotaria sp. Silwood2]|nr:unnamed protein product [Rotaria sp. Silwood2]CAF4272899.1 unnamed protein product [Rotaria sp. Silwood2]